MKTRAFLILIASFAASAFAVGSPSTAGSIVTRTSDYVCVPSNRLIIVDASTSSVTITLPSANASGQQMEVLVKDGTNNVTVVAGGTNVIVDPSGGTKMGGQAFSSCAAGEAVQLESDGIGTWYVIMARNNACSNWVSNAPPATATAQVPPGTGSGQLNYWDNNLKKWVVTTGKSFPATITTSGSVGLEVHGTGASGGSLDNTTHYMDFYDANNHLRGCIQGQNITDLTADPNYQANMKINDMNIATATIGAGISTADLAMSVAQNLAEDIPGVCLGGGLVVCVGGSESPTDIAWTLVDIGIKTANEVNGLLTVSNAQAGEDAYVASVKNNFGVSYSSVAADYAEWLPKFRPEEKFAAGQIVGVFDGRISKNTEGASQLMVISSVPVILGNVPPVGQEKDYEKVAFMGQVPVVVTGPVKLGDYILPNALNSGRGVAVSPDKMKVTDYKKIVGVAWTASADNSPKIVNVAVGLNGSAINGVIEKQDAALTSHQTGILELRESVRATQDALATLIPGFTGALAKEQTERAAIVVPQQIDHASLSKIALDDMAANKAKIPAFIPLSDAKVQAGLDMAMKICKEAGYKVETNSYMKKYETDPGFKAAEVARVKALVSGKLEKYTELMSRRADDNTNAK